MEKDTKIGKFLMPFEKDTYFGAAINHKQSLQ